MSVDPRRRCLAAGCFAALALLGLTQAGCIARPEIQELAADPERVQAIRAGLLQGGGGAAHAAQAPQGTGWATLAGTFKFEPGATPRKRRPLAVNKDPQVCAPGGKPVLDEVLLVDSATGGIANVAVYLRKASRVHPSAKADDAQVVFDQQHCVFLSHVAGVRVGQTLLIKNSDPVGHNTNIGSPGMKGVSFNQTIPTMQAKPFKPTAEENAPIDVACSIHPWMHAYLLPRSDGYFAVTAPDGSFRLENLPAGEDLELQVWHEAAVGPGGGLPVDRKDLKWSNRGRFKINLKENEERTLQIVVPASSFKS